MSNEERSEARAGRHGQAGAPSPRGGVRGGTLTPAHASEEDPWSLLGLPSAQTLRGSYAAPGFNTRASGALEAVSEHEMIDRTRATH